MVFMRENLARMFLVTRIYVTCLVAALLATSAAAAPADFEAVSLSWYSPAPVTAKVRVSSDGAKWSEWIELAIDGDSSMDGRFVSAITHFGVPQRFIEYSFSGKVDGVSVLTFEIPEKRRPRIASAAMTFGATPIRSREEWGCPDGESSRWTPQYTTVTHAVVHHTAGANTLQDWDAEIRNIWTLHTIGNGWGDIGYNFLIAPDGTIYEGRAGGNGAIGAHFSCRNSNTVGVALLGTFSNVSPTPEALASLKRILGEIINRDAIDPTAVRLHPSSGLNLPTIIGHRDGNVPGATCTITECPGDVLYSMLPAYRSELAVCRPSIDTQPASTFVKPGEEATLSVTPRGSEPFSYQWFAGTTPIANATSATVTVLPSSTAMYWVRVTNGCGSVESATATVSVTGDKRRAVRR